MPDDRISLRQLLALLFAALLAPAIGVLPSQTAALAGEAGWLSALAALPVLLGLCWVLFALNLLHRSAVINHAANLAKARIVGESLQRCTRQRL